MEGSLFADFGPVCLEFRVCVFVLCCSSFLFPGFLLCLADCAQKDSGSVRISMRDSFENVPVNDAAGPAMREATR